MKNVHWKNYVNDIGDFHLPGYLYDVIKHLMKTSLDMGTMLSDDPAKTRAFKERVKTIYQDQWLQIAEIFEMFDIITPCLCKETGSYCEVCGGARYLLNQALAADSITETAIVFKEGSKEIQEKLKASLPQALKELRSSGVI